MGESRGLGQAMISLVRDLEPGLLLLVSALCYLFALFAFAQGLLRLFKTSEDKFHAPSGGGTALSFIICIVMAALPSFLGAASESLFGAPPPRLAPPASATGDAAPTTTRCWPPSSPWSAWSASSPSSGAPSCCAPRRTRGPAPAAGAPSPTWPAVSPPGTCPP